ncbi:hypothetical protein OG455_33480 [Kitasatospora sp. NBC_01287]|uniref:hypothetical protein n=1 Tax=Kitasatospora sp. NBC_01287 TaxID=2903573 RepID=UPI0022575628|nr:hypothetical protein [Kitasatospora sp. NBC_01287]MCX4750366.1 hypothetical protein [Kitasatospora sp. NBC_01287]
MSTTSAVRRPGDSLARPYDHAAAEADLNHLGRELDRQVTARTGISDAELNATLGTMSGVHRRVLAEQAAELSAGRPKAPAVRQHRSARAPRAA